MTRTSIFLDASYWIALVNASDVHHSSARNLAAEIAREDYGNPVTSDYVFDESVGVILRKFGFSEASSLGKLILNSEAFLVRIDTHLFNSAWNIFTAQKPDTRLFSFTDCTNIAAMHALGTYNIATFDKKFKELEGIAVIP